MIRTTADLRDKAIAQELLAPGHIEDHLLLPVDLSSPQAKEPLADIAMYAINGQSFYARQDGLNAPYYRSFRSASNRLWLRKSVAERLATVNKGLQAYNVEVLVLDGYRSIALQEELWHHFMEQAVKVLSDPTPEACVEFARTYCADPREFDERDSKTWTNHITGGAVDLTLINLSTKHELFFGGIFDDASELSHTKHFENHTDTVKESSYLEAMRNRRLLYWSMKEAGFSNYPYEWWHYDYGNQLWLKHAQKGEGAAFYGPASPPG
jgi:D-alanyl-D-alanine dipeptidase